MSAARRSQFRAIRLFALTLLGATAAVPQAYSPWKDASGDGVYYRWVSKTYQSTACMIDVQDQRKVGKTAAAVIISYSSPDAGDKSRPFRLALSSLDTQTYFINGCSAITGVVVSGVKRS